MHHSIEDHSMQYFLVPSMETVYVGVECPDYLLQQINYGFYSQHLLTCNVDGKEISNVENCINRLKMMDAQGQVWGQDMLLQVKDNRLLLTDIEAEVSRASLSYCAHHVMSAGGKLC